LPQDRGIAVCHLCPGLLRSNAHARSLERRLRRRALVDPSAGVIAIDADGGEIDDLAPTVRQQVAERRDGGIAGGAGRDRHH